TTSGEPRTEKFADIQDELAHDEEGEDDEDDDDDDEDDDDEDDDDEEEGDDEEGDDDDADDEGDETHGHKGDDFDTTLDTIESTSRPHSVRPSPDDPTVPSQFRRAQERAVMNRVVVFSITFLCGIVLWVGIVKWRNKVHSDSSQPVATTITTAMPAHPTSSGPDLPPFVATDTTAQPTDTAPTTTAPTSATAPTPSHTTTAAHTATLPTATTATATNPTGTSTDTTANTATPPSDPNAAASAAALAAQAQAALEKGQTGLAISLAKKAVDRDPHNAEAWLILGAAQDTAGNHAAARAAYTACVKRGEGVRVSECRALVEP
ncbi:MAG: tetratricopeptide repeat protein, partial [Polyangiaceae bacterium]